MADIWSQTDGRTWSTNKAFFVLCKGCLKRRANANVYQNKDYDIHSVSQALHTFSDSKRTEDPEYHMDRRALCYSVISTQ